MSIKTPLLVLALMATACSGPAKPFNNQGTALNPVTGKADEAAIARREKQKIDPVVDPFERMVQIHGGLFTADRAIIDYVQSVGQTVAKQNESSANSYQFVVTNNSYPEAFAFCGGKVAVSRGLLAQLKSEAELAAVLANQVALSSMPSLTDMRNAAPTHDLSAYDSPLPVANPTFQYAMGDLTKLDNVSFNEGFEIEADALSTKWLSDAGYNAEAAVSFNSRCLSEKENPLWSQSYLSCHPCTPARAEALTEAVTHLTIGGFVGSDKYLAMTAPLREQADAYRKLKLANKALWTGNPDAALMQAKEGRAQAPNEPRFFSMMGRAYFAQGRFTEAIAAFNQAINHDPSYYENYLQRGLTFLEMGNFSDARKDLEKSLGILPTAEAHYHLGEIALETKQIDLARRHFFKASGTDAPIASLAAEQLATLDLQSNPAKYVSLRASLDGRGFLTIAAVNNSPVPINQVVVSLRVINTPGVRNANKVIRFSDEIPAGKAQASLTDVGPFDGKEHLRSCLEATVVGANPMISAE